MQRKNQYPFVSFILVLILVSLACGSAQPTPTQAPTSTVTVVASQTPRPTSTPRPTATKVPPTPTPASIGVPVVYDSLEITVLDVMNRESVHFGDVAGGWETFYKPLAGRYLIDVGVLVHNLKPGNAVHMKWNNVYVVEASGDAWYPVWGTLKTVSADKKMDPFTMGLSSINIDGDEAIEFDNNTYMRLIFSVNA